MHLLTVQIEGTAEAALRKSTSMLLMSTATYHILITETIIAHT
jgi:hypothetical protein